jgi:hypothetical protein
MGELSKIMNVAKSENFSLADDLFIECRHHLIRSKTYWAALFDS